MDGKLSINESEIEPMDEVNGLCECIHFIHGCVNGLRESIHTLFLLELESMVDDDPLLDLES